MIRLFLLVALVMCAFAANSLLNRIGIAWFGMAPIAFAVLRVAAGALMLWAIIAWQGRWPAMTGWRRLAGAAALAGYMTGFSLAYLTLDAGIGALILFGVIQTVIFGWTAATGQRIPPLRWIGAGIAFGGLCLLLWPGAGVAVPATGALAMAGAGIAWAIYTLLGRAETDALGASAVNFLLALPLVALFLPTAAAGTITPAGLATALAAGAITSGLGYAVWYRILPRLAATQAGIAQLSVPVLTVFAGAGLLGEPVDPRLVLAGALVVGGIALSLWRSAR